MVSYLDEQVGDIVSELKKLGLYENTLILFSSDNGPTYNGGSDSAYFDSASPFKSEYGWAKGFSTEGGIRVPMIASWEGTIKGGRTSQHVSAFWDVLPTLCELSGASVPSDVDGLSFVPTLLGEPQEPHEFLYWEFPAYEGQQAVRMGDWKALRKGIFKGNMDLELYNLKTDPREQFDVSKENPNVVAKIEAIMKTEREPAVLERFKIKQLGD
jgi:arylsulfatase